jgi:hypothetical protein
LAAELNRIESPFGKLISAAQLDSEGREDAREDASLTSWNNGAGGCERFGDLARLF